MHPACVADVRAAEAAAMEGAPEGDLMRRASLGLAGVIGRVIEAQGTKATDKKATERKAMRKARVVILAGAGNNGGDALFAGAELAAAGVRVVAVTTGSSWHLSGMAALLAATGEHVESGSASDDELRAIGDACDVLVDGVVGIGGSGALRAPIVRALDLLTESDPFVVSVDIPSGVDADTGTVAGRAVSADVTVTFGALKPGLLIAPGKSHAGVVELIDIGIDAFLPPSRLAVLEDVDVAVWLPEPRSDGHKYSRGVVGVVAGSPAYPGAALLCTGAARLGGVGMAHYLDRGDGLAAQVIARYPDVVASGADPRSAARITGWVCGCGFDRAVDADAVRAVLAVDRPVVLDASALSIVADDPVLRSGIAERGDAGSVTIITPHEGEFEAMFPGALATGRLDAALHAAAEMRAIVVLKGPGTIIASPDGAVRIDTEGTAVLSCAGSGDVLAGLIASVVAAAHARGEESMLDATAAAVWIHGRSGRIAGARGRPITALDILDRIPDAISHARRGETS